VTDQYVVADAVKFVPKNAAKTATWAIEGITVTVHSIDVLRLI
jgi:hypothetical protein